MNRFDRTLGGFRFVEVYHGDTLQRIAARELGDAARWTDLANINELVPPYLVDIGIDASPGVLRYGDMLMVPSAAEVASTQTDPDLVFEIDCALPYGLLESENGDFVIVSGVANLKQALQHRIRTSEGELVFHPDYRCLVHRLIGAINGPTSGLLAAEYVKAALLRDDRVQDVTRVVAEISGDVIKVTADAVPIAGRSVTVEI